MSPDTSFGVNPHLYFLNIPYKMLTPKEKNRHDFIGVFFYVGGRPINIKELTITELL